nr:hypothetical protein [Brevibacillus laterosporus]
MSSKKKYAIKWYQENRELYSRLALKVELTIKDILDHNKISYLSVNHRAKKIDSFTAKAYKDKYVDPLNEIMDLAGIRVIAYVESDVAKICKVIEEEFDIDRENSVNKSENMRLDQFGYRSVHYIAKFSPRRLQLPEFNIYSEHKFEIQVRTILQHAWAEIEHDRNYKINGNNLPDEKDIKRRFYLLAANLESIDRQFDEIVADIDKYEKEVTEDTISGKLGKTNINAVSLPTYLNEKLSMLIDLGLNPTLSNNENEIINELFQFGIITLADLEGILTQEFISNYSTYLKKPDEYIEYNENFLSLLRNAMLKTNMDKYMETCWKNKWFVSIHEKKLFTYLGLDFKKFIKNWKVIITDIEEGP